MGGLTPCLRTAQAAEDAGVECAPHFLPGLFVHLAAAATNVTRLEHFPVLEPLLTGWPAIDADGWMTASGRSGHGLDLAGGAREAFRIDR
jgi:L-alanine-DL-glutamate epimerase-like enolase superfamily enzyme